MPEPVQEPMPETVDQPVEDAILDVVEAAEEVTDEPPRRDRERPRPRRKARDEDDEPEERPRRRSLKKGGIPLWVWLVSGGVGLMLLCGCCGIGGIFIWDRLSGMSINLDSYNKIEHGMTPTQVQAILGVPTESSGVLGLDIETWKSADSYIMVTFQNGKATHKSCSVPYGAGTLTRQDVLGP
jgi:hypothetical protein